VQGLSNVSGAEKAALMARESLDAGAREVYALTGSGTKGQRMGYRSTANAAAIGTGSAARTFPNVWLRLKRAGNVFTTYTSADGVNWTTLGSVTIAMPSTMYVGMAVSSFSSTTTATAQFRNLSP
jgi:regulation of enolase protein 1 (concanavalin A-like superfamily)